MFKEIIEGRSTNTWWDTSARWGSRWVCRSDVYGASYNACSNLLDTKSALLWVITWCVTVEPGSYTPMSLEIYWLCSLQLRLKKKISFAFTYKCARSRDNLMARFICRWLHTQTRGLYSREHVFIQDGDEKEMCKKFKEIKKVVSPVNSDTNRFEDHDTQGTKQHKFACRCSFTMCHW